MASRKDITNAVISRLTDPSLEPINCSKKLATQMDKLITLKNSKPFNLSEITDAIINNTPLNNDLYTAILKVVNVLACCGNKENRKHIIELSLPLPFVSIILKYDYHFYGNIDTSICVKYTHIVAMGNKIATATDTTIKIYEGKQLFIKRAVQYLLCIVALSPIRLLLVFQRYNSQIWNIETNTLEPGPKSIIHQSIKVLGDLFVYKAHGYKFRVWNIMTQSIHTSVFRDEQDSLINIYSFLNDGRIIMYNDDQPQIWKDKTLEYEFMDYTFGWVTEFVQIQDRIVMKSLDTISLWNLNTKEYIDHNTCDCVIQCMLVLEDFRIVYACKDQTIRVWDEKETHILSCENGIVQKMALLPSGDILMGTQLGCIGVLNTRTYTYDYNFITHTKPISLIHVTSDTKVIISSYDNNIRVYN